MKSKVIWNKCISRASSQLAHIHCQIEVPSKKQTADTNSPNHWHLLAVRGGYKIYPSFALSPNIHLSMNEHIYSSMVVFFHCFNLK